VRHRHQEGARARLWIFCSVIPGADPSNIGSSTFSNLSTAGAMGGMPSRRGAPWRPGRLFMKAIPKQRQKGMREID
jgi:hypothetical protein